MVDMKLGRQCLDTHLVCLQGASDRHDLSCCGPHPLQVTMFAFSCCLAISLAYLMDDPFSNCPQCPSVSERVLHIIDDHRLVIKF